MKVSFALLSFVVSSTQFNTQGCAAQSTITWSQPRQLSAVLHDEGVGPGCAANSLTERLVRFRKNLPTTTPCVVAQANWERLIKPLFPEHQLVDQTLVKLKPGKIIAKLNEELRGWELHDYSTKGSLWSNDPRPTKRQGVYLADEDHALLITDMTPRKCIFKPHIPLIPNGHRWIGRRSHRI